MSIDPRLNNIDDCLYRVAVRALVVQNGKVLLIQEVPEMWWAFPGGGVEHGETVKSSLIRELEEELGLQAQEIFSDFQIVYYDIGKVVNGIPRMNLFYKISVTEKLSEETTRVAKWSWFTKNEFLKVETSPSYDKIKLADVIFGV